MSLALFAEIHVSDFEAALAWYERLLGRPPTFAAHATEVVWELAENRSIAVELAPDRAGASAVSAVVDDLESLEREISARGISPTADETYANGVRKLTYRDPDGNEVGFGGLPD